MNLSVEVKPDFNNTIQITDYTKELGEYIPEEVTEDLLEYFRFKYSDTLSINVVKYQSSKGLEVIRTVFSDHNVELETDSIRVPVEKDGYYTVDHIVLPTTDWFDRVKDKDLSGYNAIYVTNGAAIYKYSYGELINVPLEEVIEVNPADTTISISSYDVYNMSNMWQCYINLCKLMFDSCPGKCSKINEESRFNRDFIWMTLNVIKYYVEAGMFVDALLTLEETQGCYAFCPSVDLTKPKKSCGCRN